MKQLKLYLPIGLCLWGSLFLSVLRDNIRLAVAFWFYRQSSFSFRFSSVRSNSMNSSAPLFSTSAPSASRVFHHPIPRHYRLTLRSNYGVRNGAGSSWQHSTSLMILSVRPSRTDVCQYLLFYNSWCPHLNTSYVPLILSHLRTSPIIPIFVYSLAFPEAVHHVSVSINVSHSSLVCGEAWGTEPHFSWLHERAAIATAVGKVSKDGTTLSVTMTPICGHFTCMVSNKLGYSSATYTAGTVRALCCSSVTVPQYWTSNTVLRN